MDEISENPPENPTASAQSEIVENDQRSENPAEASPSFVAAIKSAASGAYERAGQFLKPGRGRPRKDGSPKSSDILLDNSANGESGGAAPVQVDFGAITVSKATSAVVKSVCGVAEAKIYKLAKLRSGGDKKFAEEICGDLRPTEEELNAIGELANICLKKYGVGTKFAPEIGLGAYLLGIGVRYSVALQKLSEEPPRIVPLPKMEGGK